ncbi:MAG: hypothetical protein PF545_05245 [Elusimicrobia bacterium]|nr:hypothetical protein [Elusimicrobiota bacterium]
MIFIIVIAEIATGFYLYKYILPHYGKRKSAVFSFALSSLYIPVLTLLISEIHTILGLSYNAEISGFGWTIFPLIVFLPFA